MIPKQNEIKERAEQRDERRKKDQICHRLTHYHIWRQFETREKSNKRQEQQNCPLKYNPRECLLLFMVVNVLVCKAKNFIISASYCRIKNTISKKVV